MRFRAKSFVFFSSFLLTVVSFQAFQSANALPVCYMILDDQSDVIVNLESICNQGTLSPSEDYSAPSAQELFRLAMEKFNSSDIEASIDLLSQAIEADPSSFQYYAARAEGYRYIQDRRAAISDYESTIEMIKSNGTVDDAQLIEYYENRLMTLGQ